MILSVWKYQHHNVFIKNAVAMVIEQLYYYVYYLKIIGNLPYFLIDL